MIHRRSEGETVERRRRRRSGGGGREGRFYEAVKKSWCFEIAEGWEKKGPEARTRKGKCSRARWRERRRKKG